MKPFLELHLQNENERPQGTNLPKPEGEEEKPVVLGKRLNRFVNRAAHKAAGEFRKTGGSGLFSK